MEETDERQCLVSNVATSEYSESQDSLESQESSDETIKEAGAGWYAWLVVLCR